MRTLASVTVETAASAQDVLDGECVNDVELPCWLKVSEVVQAKVLVLLASSSNARKWHKTLGVNRRLFTREDLQNIDV